MAEKSKKEKSIRKKVVEGFKAAKVLPGSLSSNLFDNVTKKIKKASK